MNYFTRKEEMKQLAVKHNKLTDKPKEYLLSVENTCMYYLNYDNKDILMSEIGKDIGLRDVIMSNLDKIYTRTEESFNNEPLEIPRNCNLLNCTTMEAVRYYYNALGGRMAILNFASYKNPGGMFIEGSSAQEESICHETNLYHILSHPSIVKNYYEPNKKSLNRALYKTKALYTPDVKLYLSNGGYKNARIDVITCAAPNYKAFRRYHTPTQIDLNENTREVKYRIELILEIARIYNIETLILGAFGCGVFGQDPITIGFEFIKALQQNNPFIDVLFAVPGNDINYKVFKSIFTKLTNK